MDIIPIECRALIFQQVCTETVILFIFVNKFFGELLPRISTYDHILQYLHAKARIHQKSLNDRQTANLRAEIVLFCSHLTYACETGNNIMVIYMLHHKTTDYMIHRLRKIFNVAVETSLSMAQTFYYHCGCPTSLFILEDTVRKLNSQNKSMIEWLSDNALFPTDLCDDTDIISRQLYNDLYGCILTKSETFKTTT
jgi:hypothetical protein